MENLNSVCYINTITSISPIEGADRIEQCQINGWNSIVQKGKHKVGDKILCITTDAVIPQSLVDMWGVGDYLRKGNRVRTIKLKGVVSDCLIIGMSLNSYKVGEDMMAEFGVFKYEPPVRNINLGGGKTRKYRDNPHFHIYHKFPNQKNTPDMFKDGDVVSITQKIHGTNARYGLVLKSRISIWDRIKKLFGNKWVEYDFVYGSHNVEKGSLSQGFYGEDVWLTIANEYKIKEKLWKLAKYLGKEKLGDGIIIYGEIFGPGIQGDNYTYGKSKISLELFDIELNNKYLGNVDFYGVCDLLLEMPYVKELYYGKWNKEIQDSLVNNKFIEGTKVPHEGIVVKCITGDRSRVSKVINPDYLIFGEKHNTPDSH